jgi:hypothetical protein
MPIPPFDDVGHLPVGEHPTSWHEFKLRYGYNAVRSALIERIEEWLSHIKHAGSRTVYIDGSFVTAKDNPGDYDACWDFTGVDMALIEPCLLDPTPSGQMACKQRFGGDLRPDRANPPGSIMPYVQFFQRDTRMGGRRKGIIRIDLSKDFP